MVNHRPISISAPQPANSHNILPLVVPDFVTDPEYNDIYSKFRGYIEPKFVNRKFSRVYRFQLTTLCMDEVIRYIELIFREQTSSYKLAISLSYILLNRETDELTFYWASQNNQKLLDSPHFVGSHQDLENISKKLKAVNFQSHVTYPNSKFVFRKATNVEFYVTRLPNIPIGAGTILPQTLRRNKGILSLTCSPKTGRPFSDSLCFFRCLAIHRGATVHSLETPTKALFTEFCESFGITSIDFDGVCLGQLSDLSELFNVGICVYQLDESDNCELVFRSLKNNAVMNLNLFGNHFSLIKDFGKYSSSYLCLKCKRSFDRKFNMVRHTNICDASTKNVYGSGVFHPPQTIFDQLSDHGVDIPNDLHFFEERICFDIESILVRDTNIPNTDRVTFTFRHELASISVASNVEGFEEPVCFISEGCPKKLLRKAIEHMQEIAVEVEILQRTKFEDYIELIEELDDAKVVEKFDEYMSQVPVISFNGNLQLY